MAVTLTNLQTKLSYRMAEDSVPTSSGSEWARRTQFLNEGLHSVLRKHYWWWTEASTTFSSVANQTSYSTSDGFPSDIRNSAILELRFNNVLYTPVLQSEVFDLESVNTGLSKKYYVFNKKLWPINPFESTISNGISIKYYKISADLSSGSDTIDIPDEYADVLVAFALGRLSSLDSERGSAADAFDEYKEIYKEMEVEQNNYLFALKATSQDFSATFE